MTTEPTKKSTKRSRSTKLGEVYLQFRIPTRLHSRLTKAADERMVSVSLLAGRAIEEFLGRLGSVEDSLKTRDSSADKNDAEVTPDPWANAQD